MRLNRLNRQTHFWASAVISVPILIVICSGLLLQVKKHWNWVQPVEQWGTGTSPQLDLDGILASVRGVPQLEVAGWEDIHRLDIRPSRGLAKASLHSGWEVQVDLGTGRVLQIAPRRSELIESIHDGSFFAGDLSKLGIFLPTGIMLLLLWLTGLWMVWLPVSLRRRRSPSPKPSSSVGR